MSETRTETVRKYLLEILADKVKKLNIDYLDSKIESYNITRLPVDPLIENWIIPVRKKREVYNFESRKTYSQDVKSNLENIGFFESLENTIYENNKKRILPNIENIESIECLNCGTLQSNDTNTGVFSIQIQITYREVYDETN